MFVTSFCAYQMYLVAGNVVYCRGEGVVEVGGALCFGFLGVVVISKYPIGAISRKCSDCVVGL